jgi:branched-chain amino acid transport system ATP-binding protein
MLALGRALMQRPKLLLLDEPSLGLSPNTMTTMFGKIKDISSTGVSVLIIEQNAKAAVEMADRTYVLGSGRIAFEGGKDTLKDSRIRGVYLGRR